MPNVAQVLRAEIRRLAAKTLREAQVAAQLRSLRRRIRQIEKRVKSLESRPAFMRAPAAAAAPEAPRRGRRFKATPPVLRKIRAKLGVTQKELAALLGVSGNAVWQWEAGRAAPRRKALAALQQLKKIGKREARRRLAAM